MLEYKSQILVIENPLAPSEPEDLLPVTRVYGMWERRFFTSFMLYPEGPVGIAVAKAVNDGIVGSQPIEHFDLANTLGTVFSYAYDAKTGREKAIEDINYKQIAQKTALDQEKLEQIGKLMAETDILKSRERIKRRRFKR